MEANGNICIGTLDRGGITVVHPASGSAEFVPGPGDTHCTDLCFGGPNLRKAYVTQSYAGGLVELDWPRPWLAQILFWDWLDPLVKSGTAKHAYTLLGRGVVVIFEVDSHERMHKLANQ